MHWTALIYSIHTLFPSASSCFNRFSYPDRIPEPIRAFFVSVCSSTQLFHSTPVIRNNLRLACAGARFIKLIEPKKPHQPNHSTFLTFHFAQVLRGTKTLSAIEFTDAWNMRRSMIWAQFRWLLSLMGTGHGNIPFQCILIWVPSINGARRAQNPFWPTRTCSCALHRIRESCSPSYWIITICDIDDKS